MVTHAFDTEVAAKYGIGCAVILNRMLHWVIENEANGINHFDGRTWTYNSVDALHKIYHYMSPNAIRRYLDKLVEEKVLVTGCYNKSPWDKTKWYAFHDIHQFHAEFSHLPFWVNRFAKTADRSADMGKPIPLEDNLEDTLKKKNSPSTASTVTDLQSQFHKFWEAYPKKVGKLGAFTTWMKRRPPLDKCLETIEKFKETPSWKEEGGRFVPNPQTWLNRGGWDDVPCEPSRGSGINYEELLKGC